MTGPAPRPLSAWLPYLWRRAMFPAAPDTTIKITAFSVAVLIILPALLLYPTLGFHLLEPDEGRYAQIPKEMYLRGEWVVPTLQGEAYLDKPPLMYWLVKLSYTVFGVTEAAARLVPAVCVHLTLLAVYLLGRRSVGERSAFWAALLLSVAPGYAGIARLLLLDGLLTLTITTSLLCGYEAIRTGQFRMAWWLAAAMASGLGFLTKGPISEILLFPPLFAAAWLSPTLAKVSLRNTLLFLFIVLAINTPWYIAIYLREPVFLKHFFWDHNVMRFVQPFDHLQPVWYYAPILLLGLLPGTILLVPLLRSLWQGRSPLSQAGGFWLLAGTWCVLFFSVSGSKLPTYILPAYPLLCLAMGEFVARGRWQRPATVLTVSFALMLGMLFHVGLPWYAEVRSPLDNRVRSLIEGQPVVTYPRHCDSVAYYCNRSDFVQVRSKDVNDLMVAMHHRPRTVILFTHKHSFEAFRDALPSSLTIAEHLSLKRPATGLLGKLAGDTPWGLADVAVIEPR